jgi:hypothetical protein
MTTFQLESVDVWAKESRELMYAHWQELGLDLDLELDPDIQKMKAMEDLGMWKVITAREDGRMVGYMLMIFGPHLHYRSSPPMSFIDAYYVSPDCRRGTGAKLILFMEGIARRLGAIKIYLSCKVHKDHMPLFTALGYRLSDFACTKRI